MKCPHCSFSPLLPLFWDIKTASDAAHYLLEEYANALPVMSFKSFNRRCFDLSRNSDGAGGAAESKSAKITRGFL